MTINVDKRDTILRRCDKTIAFSLYASIYFLVISAAIVESFFGIILCSYLYKRGVVFYYALKEKRLNKEKLSFVQTIALFLKSYKPVANPLNKSISFYILAAFLSIFVSYYPLVGLKGFVFRLLQGTFLYFLFIEVINTRRRLKTFLIVYLVSLTLGATNGIYQYFAREGFIRNVPVTDGRITSAFKHANDFSAYLIMVIPLLICIVSQFLFFGKNKGPSEWTFFKSLPFRIVVGILCVGAIVCLGLTYARAAWIALALSLLCIGFRNKKVLILIVLTFSLFMAFFVPKMLNERTTNIISEKGFFEVNDRIIYLVESYDIFEKHPILGVGLNNYSLVAPKFTWYWGGYPHNCYLQMAVEIGVLGLGSFLWIIFALYKTGLSALKSIKDTFPRSMLFGLMMGFGAFLIHSFFDTDFYSNRLGMLLWLILGFIVALQKVEIATQDSA